MNLNSLSIVFLLLLILEPDLKKRIRVHLLNAHGLDEAGIDGGGIFREFLNELLKSGFNPNQGFFKTTNDSLLYPSPAAEMLVGDSFTRHYYFLGRLLGKVSVTLTSKMEESQSFPGCLHVAVKVSMRSVAVGVKVASTINVNLYLVFMFVLVADIVQRNCHH